MTKEGVSGIWQFEIIFDKYVLYPGQKTVSGNIGIHLTDWTSFDKTLLGLVLLDETGEILWGVPWNGNDETLYPEYVYAF